MSTVPGEGCEDVQVGDSIGDLAMLERVGVPVVVANAAPPLLELVTHQVAGVDDCGAAEALALATTLAP